MSARAVAPFGLSWTKVDIASFLFPEMAECLGSFSVRSNTRWIALLSETLVSAEAVPQPQSIAKLL
jgi:hypothetical protein